ncbi:hypothetical protein JMJ35_004401 [Cladonia borealis]|uniref:BTB domain-containing protein n=1 Tax=Cladonia borealis TaxID=184061 RepID=A0AA39R252_9LECA|nr:hypothetical protein JMJ35_004401 [Cladonia borealis]
MLILNELHPEYEQVSSLSQGCDEMSPLVEDIYTSAPSRFIVDGQSLYIHGQLVSRHSKPLSAKIKARNDFTIIDSVDKDTFARFIEWAYKGYYTAAEHWIDAGSPSLSKFEDSDTCTPEAEPPFSCVEEAPAPAPTGPEPEPELDFGWASFGSKKSKKTGKKTKLVWDEPALEPPLPEECTPVCAPYECAAPAAECAPAECAPEEPTPAEPTTEPELELDDGWGSGGWGSFGSKKSKKTGKKTKLAQPRNSSKESLKESFYARKYEIRQHTITIPPPRPNQEPNENYTPVFLSHTHLYVFARKYDIPTLQTLALENLHMTLESFTLHPERTADIIDLLDYIYSSRELKEGGFEDMREMLKGYIGFEMDVLMKDRAFRGLMKEEGELLDDFVEMVGKRI